MKSWLPALIAGLLMAFTVLVLHQRTQAQEIPSEGVRPAIWMPVILEFAEPTATPTVTPTATSTPLSSPTPTATLTTPTDILVNGDFRGGLAGWSGDPAYYGSWGGCLAGSSCVWLRSSSGVSQFISQPFTVPAGSRAATIRMHYHWVRNGSTVDEAVIVVVPVTTGNGVACDLTSTVEWQTKDCGISSGRFGIPHTLRIQINRGGATEVALYLDRVELLVYPP